METFKNGIKNLMKFYVIFKKIGRNSLLFKNYCIFAMKMLKP